MGAVINSGLRKKHNSSVEVSVTPMLLNNAHPLASVGGTYNAIMVEEML